MLLDDGETGCPAGFVQGRRHVDGAAADLTFLAPACEAEHGAALTWQRLLSAFCRHMGGLAVRSVLVRVEQDANLAIQIVRRSGFLPVDVDTVMRRPFDPAEADPTPRVEQMSPQPTSSPSSNKPDDPSVYMTRAFERHDHAIDGLVRATQPPALKQAFAGGEPWRQRVLGGHSTRAEIARVRLDAQGAVTGAWRLIQGRQGHWLQVVAGPDGDAERLVADATSELARSGWPTQPLFARAAGYEPGLHLALRHAGFAPVITRYRFVRHTAVRVLAPAWKEQPGLLGVRSVRPAAQSRGSIPLRANARPHSAVKRRHVDAYQESSH